MNKRALNNLVSNAAALVLIVLLLGFLSGSASATTPHPRIPCSPGVTPCIDMYVVAHQDDDLLFMNPDIQNSILSGNRVVTVFVTTGCLQCDGSLDPDVVYWTGREKGAINAYTFMANPSQASTSADALPAGWSYAPLAVAGIKVATYHYKNSADITLIFLRIPDFASGDEAVKLLWESAVPSVTLFSCQNLCPYAVRPLPVVTYTRQLLLDVLAGLMSHYRANSVSTTDGTNLYQTNFSTPGDGDAPENPSHFFSGLFVTSAIAQAEGTGSGAARALRLYRGYTTSNEPENASDEEAFPKLLTFARYALYDPDVGANPDSTLDAPDFIFSGYQTEWPHRKYATRQIQNTGVLTGRLMTTNADGSGGGCLRANGTLLSFGDCNGATSWTLTERSQIKFGASCIDLLPDHGGVDGLILDTCQSPAVATQSLRLFGNGQIRSFDGSCLQGAGTIANAAPCDRQVTVNLQDPNGLCLGGTNTAVPCPSGIPVPAQNWTLIFDPTTLLSTQFSNATEIPNFPYYYRSFGIAGNQVCARRELGVMCAAYKKSHGAPGLAPGVYLPDAFPDSEGWANDPNGSTVRAFVEAGSIVACGRGYYGVGCTSGIGTSDYSNAQGWASEEWFYGSIRYVDIDSDSHHDICGRGYYGISCSIAGPTQFAVATLWSDGYSDADGWDATPYGEAIQFGDISGDGFPDVCGRSIYGMECSSNDLPAAMVFNRRHNWSEDADRTFPRNLDGSRGPVQWEFSDADPFTDWKSQPSYYRSIQLVDINHDGFADVCGRGPGGIYCALSTGTGFEPLRNVLPFDFTDALGWDADNTGSTISFGYLDGSSRIWVCGRGYYGVVCAKGY